MERIQPGHDVILLFGFKSHSKTLNKKIASHGSMIASFLSAFFIILAVSFILGVATRILGPVGQSIAATPAQEEKVAFTPGQFVSNEISQGYLGTYR